MELDTIASLPDPRDREEVVKLVASGTEVPKAVARVTAPPDGKVKSADGRTVATPLTPRKMPDEQWLNTIPFRERL